MKELGYGEESTNIHIYRTPFVEWRIIRHDLQNTNLLYSGTTLRENTTRISKNDGNKYYY
jgi:hypothetical protein